MFGPSLVALAVFEAGLPLARAQEALADAGQVLDAPPELREKVEVWGTTVRCR